MAHAGFFCTHHCSYHAELFFFVRVPITLILTHDFETWKLACDRAVQSVTHLRTSERQFVLSI